MYYEKKVQTVRVNHSTYQQKNVLARPRQYLDFQRCVVIFIVVSDFEVRGRFVDIDGIVDHHGLETFFS
jgi:hypothetical protein